MTCIVFTMFICFVVELLFFCALSYFFSHMTDNKNSLFDSRLSVLLFMLLPGKHKIHQMIFLAPVVSRKINSSVLPTY